MLDKNNEEIDLKQSFDDDDIGLQHIDDEAVSNLVEVEGDMEVMAWKSRKMMGKPRKNTVLTLTSVWMIRMQTTIWIYKEETSEWNLTCLSQLK